MQKWKRWLALRFTPRSSRQIEVRRELQMVSDRLHIESCGLLKSRDPLHELAISEIRAVVSSIRMLTVFGRSQFDVSAPKTIELARGYFGMLDRFALPVVQRERARFEKLVGELAA